MIGRVPTFTSHFVAFTPHPQVSAGSDACGGEISCCIGQICCLSCVGASRRAAHPSVITQTARTEYILRRHRQTDTTVDTDRQSIAIHTVPLGPGVPVPVPVPVRTYLDLDLHCMYRDPGQPGKTTDSISGWVGGTDSLVCQPPSPLCICCVFARRPKTQCILCICYPYPVYFPSRTPRRGYLYDL